jgi:hypothetical protein
MMKRSQFFVRLTRAEPHQERVWKLCDLSQQRVKSRQTGPSGSVEPRDQGVCGGVQVVDSGRHFDP